MDKVSYYQKKIKEISAYLEGSRQALAMTQQHVESQEADLLAYQNALLEESRRIGIELTPPESTAAATTENDPHSSRNNAFPQTYTDRVRALLRQSNPLTAAQIFSRMADQGTSIARPYLYALLSRMVASGEAKRANGLYIISERQSDRSTTST